MGNGVHTHTEELTLGRMAGGLDMVETSVPIVSTGANLLMDLVGEDKLILSDFIYYFFLIFQRMRSLLEERGEVVKLLIQIVGKQIYLVV